MPKRIHDVKPPRVAIRHGPVDGIAQNGERSIQARTRAAWPVRLVERGERRWNRMSRRVRSNYGAIILHKGVLGRRQIQRQRSDEDEQQLALHGSRARSESATLESPRERAANACVR